MSKTINLTENEAREICRGFAAAEGESYIITPQFALREPDLRRYWTVVDVMTKLAKIYPSIKALEIYRILIINEGLDIPDTFTL